jgi:hypothetical protein
LIAPHRDSLALPPPKKLVALVLGLRFIRISRSGNSTIFADNEIVGNRRPARKEVVREDVKGNIAVVLLSIVVQLFIRVSGNLDRVSRIESFVECRIGRTKLTQTSKSFREGERRMRQVPSPGAAHLKCLCIMK